MLNDLGPVPHAFLSPVCSRLRYPRRLLLTQCQIHFQRVTKETEGPSEESAQDEILDPAEAEYRRLKAKRHLIGGASLG